MDEANHTTFEYLHDESGQRCEKLRNGETIETYRWLDFIRLAGFHDGFHDYEFTYDHSQRTPRIMQREDTALFHLYYDNLGSLRAVADESGNVIKEILYDPFGNILRDSAPALRIPLGFAGGLHDPDLGFTRFGWRDYDPFTSRWTAPDPMEDAGGDDDWYGYCLDDPVNGVDPLGLFSESGYHEEPYFDDVWQWQTGSKRPCNDCAALDGELFFNPASAPDKLHPHCQCELVPCYYYSKFGKWKHVDKIWLNDEYGLPIFYMGPKGTIPWWRFFEIQEERKVKSYRVWLKRACPYWNEHGKTN